MHSLLDRIIKHSIYVLVVLIPLFFLPFSFEAFEFNKQYLLFFLVSLAFFTWISKMIFYDKEIRFKKTPLNFFVLAFLGVAILSAIFSVDKVSSLFGFYGRFSNGLVGLISLGALYFLVINNIREVKGLIKAFLCSVSAVVVVSYFSIFGIWAKIGNLVPLPRLMLQRTFNPVAGSLEGLSIFLAVVLVFLTGLILTRKEKNILHWLLLGASLGLLVIIDFVSAWAIILVSLVLLVGFGIWRRIFRENVNRLLIPIFLIIIAALCIPYQPQVISGLPREQVLSQQTSWQIGFDSAADNVKSGFLGSGIGTFHYDFSKYKPLEFNESWLWQIRFDRAGSHLAEILGQMGFLGIIAYLGLIGIFLMIFWFLTSGFKSFNLKSQALHLPLLVGFIGVVVSQVVYYQNSVLAFLFWLILAMTVVSWQKPADEKVISFKNFPELSLIFSTLIIIFGAVILTMYFYGGKFYLADIKYKDSLSLAGNQRIETLKRAVSLNPRFAFYRLALSRAYLAEALIAQDSARIQNMVSNSIDQAKAATQLKPNSVRAWETLGIVYREIGPVAAGATEWGVKSFEKAIELEPQNPALYTELGKLHLAAGNLEKAKESFNQARKIKANYAEATIQLALLSEREGVVEEAITELENIAQNQPLNIDVSFQLGRLYFNAGRVNEAISQFQKVIILVPGHSNAHYSLGVAYTSQGEKEKAIEEFEKVLEINPGNQDVIQKLEQLRTP